MPAKTRKVEVFNGCNEVKSMPGEQQKAQGSGQPNDEKYEKPRKVLPSRCFGDGSLLRTR